jgi:hypothetical protein
VTHEKDGLLVGEMNVAAYANAILQVMASDKRWELLAEGAIQTAAAWKSEVVLKTIDGALSELCELL